MIARRDLIRLALAAASWGVGTVVSKRAVEEIPPFTLLSIQLVAGLGVLATLMLISGQPLRGSPRLLGRLGILNPGIAYALGLAGLTYISASLSVLLWALEPLLILVLAGLFLSEGITPGLIISSLVAAGGMALVVYDPAAEGQLPGVVLTLAGIGCCAAYSVIARRFVATSNSTAQVVLAQQAYAVAFAIIVAIGATLLGAQQSLTSISPPGLLSAIASGLLYYAAAYWFYLSALRSVPASRASSSFYLIPAFGLAASFVLLGERLQPVQWLGVGVAAVAVVLILRPGSALARHGVRRDEPAKNAATGLDAHDQVDPGESALLHG